MKVFIAGATGVLGRAAVKALVAAGHDVRGTARGEEKAALLRAVGAEPVAVDLYDAEAVKSAVAGSEAVVHLATKIPPLTKVRSRKAWAENDRLRTEAAHNLGIQVIAEGIETEDDLKFCIAIDADLVQGYYLARPAEAPKPVSAESLQTLADWVRESEASS